MFHGNNGAIVGRATARFVRNVEGDASIAHSPGLERAVPKQFISLLRVNNQRKLQTLTQLECSTKKNVDERITHQANIVAGKVGQEEAWLAGSGEAEEAVFGRSSNQRDALAVRVFVTVVSLVA